MNPYKDLFTSKEFEGGRKAISVLNKNNGAAVDNILLQIIMAIELEGADTDTAYQIVDRAAVILEDNYETPFDASKFEVSELADDCASVYTGERLSYLTPSNQDDITEILKEYSCDIATACAVWYDLRVAQSVEHLASAHDELVAAHAAKVDAK